MADILKRFGRYFLLDQIAQGGMAEIFRARLATTGSTGRILTIKRIQPQFGSNPEFLSMFKSEINVTMGFNHPNIVQLYDFGEELGQPFIAMEFVDGKNLRQFMGRFNEIKQKFPVELAVFITQQAASGLHYAHSFKDKITGEPMNIVHRDISPQNILISYEGHIKIIDFGIAKAASNTESTRAGVIKGKPSYLSPEQISGEKLDGRCDLFALGIVFWELLVGRKLFSGENDLAVLKQIESCTTHVKPPSQFNPKVDAELDAIVMKALQKNRDKRYSTAEDFHRVLHKYLVSCFSDFNPTDLSYYARDLFKKEIVEDRKKIQRLNDRAESMILAELDRENLQLTGKPGYATDNDRQSTLVDPNLRFSTSGSRDRFDASSTKDEKLEVEKEVLEQGGLGRRSGGYIARHHAREFPAVKTNEKVKLSPQFESLQRKPPAKSGGLFQTKFKTILVAAGVAAAVVYGGVQYFENSQTKEPHENGRNPVSLPDSNSDKSSHAFGELIGLGNGQQEIEGKTVLLQVNIQPRLGDVGDILVNKRKVDWSNPVTPVALDKPIEVIIHRPGFKTVVKQLILNSAEIGKQTAVPLDVPMTPVRFGYLSLTTTPSSEANYMIDGEMIKRSTPILNEKLPVGTYTIDLRRPELDMSKKITIQIQENKVTKLEESLNLN